MPFIRCRSMILGIVCFTTLLVSLDILVLVRFWQPSTCPYTTVQEQEQEQEQKSNTIGVVDETALKKAKLSACYKIPPEDEDVYDWEDYRYYRNHLEGDSNHKGTTGVPMTIHFLWETKAGNVAPIQVMRLPIMSILRFMPKRPIIVHSNTLPLNFFSDFTEKVNIVVERYSIQELLDNQNLPGKEFLARFSPNQSWAFQHLSDYLRLAWLYLFGGTCIHSDFLRLVNVLDLDFDFVLAHPFPQVTNLIARSESGSCPSKYRLPHCIPREYRDCYQDTMNDNVTVFFTPHNGALLNFRENNPFLRRALELYPSVFHSNCKGCAGPGLLTVTFLDFLDKTTKIPPGLHTMPTSTVLVSRGWSSMKGKYWRWGAIICHFLHGTSQNMTHPLYNSMRSSSLCSNVFQIRLHITGTENAMVNMQFMYEIDLTPPQPLPSTVNATQTNRTQVNHSATTEETIPEDAEG